MPARDEKEYSSAFDWRVWKRMWPFIKPHLGLLLATIFANIMFAVIDIYMPLFQRYAIDNYIARGEDGGLPYFAVAYIAALAIQAGSFLLLILAGFRLEMDFGRDLRRACFVHCQELSLNYYNVTPVGYTMARVANDPNRIAELIGWQLPDILWAVFYVVAMFVSMFLLNPELAALVLLVVPFIVVLTVYFQNRILKWNRRVRKQNSKITGAFNEGITGAKTSKTLVIEAHNSAEFCRETAEMKRSAVKAARLSAIYIPIIMFFGSVVVSLVLLRGGILTTQQVMAVGTLSAFLSYAVSMTGPIQGLTQNLTNLISMQANIERVTDLLDEKPLVQDSPAVLAKYGSSLQPKRENWEPLKGDICFADVSFHYPDGEEEVLSHFHLHIPAGTTVAIVGETGAGKSTLVNLACRFFEPTGGQILIDGRDYRERSQLWLHSNIGYVLQEPHLFSGTIMENIRYGRLDATDEEVHAAAKAVSADTVVAKLDKGYDSFVGEGGDRLSTGEKQLISFARAVLADPRIFVLDEATSSIDTETEQLIQRATARLLHDRTSFLIAHRLSTIREADLILVVRDGHIVEQGTHEDLMQKPDGYYHNLYTRQFTEESVREALS